MVKTVIKLFQKEISGLHEAAYLLGFFAVLSQLLALVRDRLFAGYFGAGETLDIYYAAFRIPDILLISAASIVSVSILIPFLVQKIDAGHTEIKRFINTIFTAFFSFIVCSSVIAFFATPYLVPLLFPGFTGTTAEAQIILLTKIMLLQPILLGLSNLFGSITQAYKRFFIYASSPILYNAGIIVGITWLYPQMGIAGLGWGVVLGALLHLAIQLPVILEKGLLPRFGIITNIKELRSVIAISLPRTLALSVSNIAVLFLIALGSLIGSGSISIFNLSFNLQSVPLTIVGASYSLAAFPTLVRFFSSGERKKFYDQIIIATRHILFWSFPATVLFVVLRAQIVRTVLGFGEFSWADTRLTAAALALFALSVAAQSLNLLFVRGLYAAGKTKLPLAVNLVSGALIVAFGYGLVFFFENTPTFRFFIESLLKVSDLPTTAVLMLPLAYSLATIVNTLIFWIIFHREHFEFTGAVARTLFHSFAASVIAGNVAYSFLNIFDDVFNIQTVLGIFMQGFASGVLGLVAGAVMLKVLGNKEIAEIWRTLHHKIWKAKVVAPEPADMPSMQ